MGKTLDWDKPYGEIIGPHRASYDQDGCFFDSSGNEIRIGETSKTLSFHGDRLKPYISGKGLDIGAGRDAVSDDVQIFDIEHGDAGQIDIEGSFDYVWSSHCLEHMDNPHKALRLWWSLVKRGGYLIIIVPDEDLYEQGVWPSRYNSDHKHTFTVEKEESWSPVSINLKPLLLELGGTLELLEVQDDGYDYDAEDCDQTEHQRLAQIMGVVRRG